MKDVDDMRRHRIEVIAKRQGRRDRLMPTGPGPPAQLLLVGLVALIFLAGANHGRAAPDQVSIPSEPIVALEPLPNLDPGIIALGQRLFNDRRLSKNGKVACASCHDVAAGGADTTARSFGVTGQPTARNSPTVLNSGYSQALYWDGRAGSLEEQVDGPLRHPDEMATNWPDTLKLIAGDPTYRREFQRYNDGAVTRQAVENAIATYERSLVTLNAPFDRFLRGDTSAITPRQQDGYRLFKNLGCVSCHQGRLVGGNMYQRLGIYTDYFSKNGKENSEADFGRYNVTGREQDRYVFKVPSLRNVALTAPYLHDGSVPELEQAVGLMAAFQLGRDLKVAEIQAIVAFLRSLTGDLPRAEP